MITVKFVLKDRKNANIYARVRVESNGATTESLMTTKLHVDKKFWLGGIPPIRCNGSITAADRARNNNLNDLLKTIATDLEIIYQKLRDSGLNGILAKDVVRTHQGKSYEVASEQRITILQALEFYKTKPDLAVSTQKFGNAVSHVVKLYCKEHNLDPDTLYMDQVNIVFAESLLDFFKTKLAPQSRVNYWARLKATYKFLEKTNGLEKTNYLLYKSNAFKHVSANMTKDEKRQEDNKPDKWLTNDELQALLELDLPPKLDYHRKAFEFQSLTGLAYSDMMLFDPDNIKTKITGDQIISMRRTKTYGQFDVPVHPRVNELIEWFEKANEKPGVCDHGPSLIKVGLIQNYDFRLQQIKKLLRKEKVYLDRLSSHTARHTFAVRALIHCSLETVRQMLGHKSVKMTETIYAKVIHDKIQMERANLFAGLDHKREAV